MKSYAFLLFFVFSLDIIFLVYFTKFYSLLKLYQTIPCCILVSFPGFQSSNSFDLCFSIRIHFYCFNLSSVGRIFRISSFIVSSLIFFLTVYWMLATLFDSLYTSSFRDIFCEMIFCISIYSSCFNDSLPTFLYKSRFKNISELSELVLLVPSKDERLLLVL